jgi:hypothetical protein
MVLCSACRCHLHVNDPVCPHCGASARDAVRPSSSRWREINRLVVAATATAGLGLAACGSAVYTDPTSSTGSATASSGGSTGSGTTSGAVGNTTSSHSCYGSPPLLA